jgi:hypothetical protein
MLEFLHPGTLHMKTVTLYASQLCGLVGLALIALVIEPREAGAALEQTFDQMQVGTATYQNVTVTTKDKHYIFILHSKGMTSIKVADLPSDIRTRLGYEDPSVPHTRTNASAAWARQTLSKFDGTEVKKVQEQVAGFWHSGGALPKLQLPKFNPMLLLAVGVVLLGLYLFQCYCCMLICAKAGSEPGPLVWVPLLQIIPLLKAAEMSAWWFLGFLVPGVNLVVQIMWCIKITASRGKSFWTALFLILPVTTPFAFLYLAFSGGPASKREDRKMSIMTLETA